MLTYSHLSRRLLRTGVRVLRSCTEEDFVSSDGSVGWHHAGHAIVYMTETPASALLEACVHTSANDVPPAFTLLKIGGPDIEVPSIKADDLPKNRQAQLEVTRDLGTAWLEKNESVLLRVPSVIVPETVNFLLNPSHKLAAKFRITDVFPYPFDLRLKT